MALHPGTRERGRAERADQLVLLPSEQQAGEGRCEPEVSVECRGEEVAGLQLCPRTEADVVAAGSR